MVPDSAAEEFEEPTCVMLRTVILNTNEARQRQNTCNTKTERKSGAARAAHGCIPFRLRQRSRGPPSLNAEWSCSQFPMGAPSGPPSASRASQCIFLV